MGYNFLQAEKAEQRAKNLEEARQIVIEEDSSLPKATKVWAELLKIFSYTWVKFFMK